MRIASFPPIPVVFPTAIARGGNLPCEPPAQQKLNRHHPRDREMLAALDLHVRAGKLCQCCCDILKAMIVLLGLGFVRQPVVGTLSIHAQYRGSSRSYRRATEAKEATTPQIAAQSPRDKSKVVIKDVPMSGRPRPRSSNNWAGRLRSFTE